MVAETRGLRGVLLCYMDNFRAGLAEMESGIGAIEGLPLIVQQSANSMRDWINQVFTGQYEDASAGDEAALDRLQAAGIDYRRSYFAWYLASAGHLPRLPRCPGQASPPSSMAPLDTGGGIRLTSAFVRHGLAIAAAARGRSGGRRPPGGRWPARNSATITSSSRLPCSMSCAT